MKKFLEYITESEKKYEFKIRIAGHDIPEDRATKLETALQKYELVSFASGRKTPIQENPLHFPQIQNCEVMTYDVVVKYPATATILQKYLADTVGLAETHVLVTSPTEPFEELVNPATKNDTYEPILSKTEMEDADPDAQSKVGANRVMDLLKELEQARAERTTGNPTEGTPVGDSNDISPTVNTKSVVGG
jgi:hypothetical protein